jgi:alkylation response protein AidB-like acyl-CoA dehydrogenase
MLVERLVGQLVRQSEMGPEGSILKLFFSEARERLTSLAARVRGIAAAEAVVDQTYGNDVANINDHVRSWMYTISAGSNEIQRNIIAERILGLPREQIFN